MSNWIGLGVIAFVILSGILFLSYLSRPYDVTVEEYEKRANEAPSLLSAGVVGLQKILDPATEKAVAAQEDVKQGRYTGEQESGDPPEAGTSDLKEQTNNQLSGEFDA
jgi:hypothetical protein